MNFEVLDIALRGATTGIALVLIILFSLSRVDRESQWAFFVMVISNCAGVWRAVSETAGFSDLTTLILQWIVCSAAFGVTWFTLTIFLDNKRHAWAWLLSGALISLTIVVTPTYPQIIPFLRGYAVVHFLTLIGLVAFSAQGDLQNARRRLRPVIIVLLLAQAVWQSIASTPLKPLPVSDLNVLRSGVVWALMAIVALWSLRVEHDRWPGRTVASPWNPSQNALRQEAHEALIARIEMEMTAGIWRTEGLTVAGLAQKVDAPEHQVRKAINKGLGHRNFASFINRARIKEAQARLSNPDEARTTVLEIAYDVGFGSLGPFNRAFREVTGQSPTDYRRENQLSLKAG